MDLNERQQHVVSVLKSRSPRLEGVYRTALSALETVADDGCESARISIICHCMREVMNGLPVVMADTAIPRPKPSSGTLIRNLPKLLADHPEVDLGVDQDMIPVPREVAQALNMLIGTATREQGRNRSNAAALVTGGDNSGHPAVKQWLDTYEYFVGWAHIDRNHERGGELPSDADLLTFIRVVEDVIEVRTAVFFENLRSLEGLLADINALTEEDA